MNKSWWNSLRVKIIAWSFVPTVIILSAVAWFTFYSYQKVLGDLAIKQYPDLVQPKAMAFYNGLGALISNTVMPIYRDINTNYEWPLETRAQYFLDHAKDLEQFDAGIYFLDQQGIIFKTQSLHPELIGQDWSDTPHFRSINERPNLIAFSDLISIGSSGEKIFCFATAMTGQEWDEFTGAYYCCFNIYPVTQNAYFQYMSSLDLGHNVFIVDRNQQIMFSPDLSKIGQDLSREAYIQQLSQGEMQGGRFRVGDQDLVVSYVPVYNPPTNRLSFYVVTHKSWADIMQPSLPYRRFLYALLALGVLFPVLVTAYGVRHITEPIQKLIHASELVTAGQFKHRIEVKTGDEIETLAVQFNRMSSELDEWYALLERKVADRTRELAVLNSIISVASHSLDFQEILEDALQKTVEQMGFDAGAAFRIEAEQNSITLIAQRGFEPAITIDLVNSDALADLGSPLDYPPVVTPFEIKDFQPGKIKDQLSQIGFQGFIFIPLSSKGQELGFFILGKCQPVILSPEELSLLSSIGKQVGVAMENARLYEQAEQAAIASERHRLARELHDAVTQTLFSASLIADVIPRIWKRSPQEGMQNLEELRQLTRGALAEMRTMLLEMRPESLERADLRSLLTQLADAFVGRVRVPVNLAIHGDCELTHEVKLVFYRVAQEALNNIAKHSGARQVDVLMECQPAQLLLFIKDDGLGFEPASIPPGHLGIAIMRERASSIGAIFKIESQVGQGTTIELDWSPAQKEGIHEHASDDQRDVGG